MKPYAPLGILYLASHLRARNFDVEVFDTTFSSWPELQNLLASERPAVLGVYANLMTRGSVIRILRAAKEAGWKTVVGGPEPGAYAEEYLAAGADVVVIGEGEVTLEELLPILRSGAYENLSRVHGIAFRGEEGRVERTPPRAQIPDIDGQPWPSRESISIERYLETWRQHHGAGSVSMITARGCPYECQWCSHEVYGKTHRRRKAASVVDELEWILGRYNPDMLWFADDVFTIHHGWLAQFAAEMKRRGLSIPFECISRADRINERVADLLAELNCFRIWIGSESGSQRVLDAMRRGVTVQQVQNAVGLCKSRGIADRHVFDVGIRRRGIGRYSGHHPARQGIQSRHLPNHRCLSHPGDFLFRGGTGPRGKSKELGGGLRPRFSNPRPAFPAILPERRSSTARGS